MLFPLCQLPPFYLFENGIVNVIDNPLFVFFNRIFILDETLQLFRLAVINVCPVHLPLESLLSTHLATSEGWTAELTVGLWLVVPTTGFEPTRVDLV